jgi:hypothetical protein
MRTLTEILSDEYGNYGESADASHGVSFWAAGPQSDQGAAQVLCFSCGGTRPCKYEGKKITECDECCDKERHLSQHWQRETSYFIQATHVLAICAAIYWGLEVKVGMRSK